MSELRKLFPRRTDEEKPLAPLAVEGWCLYCPGCGEALVLQPSDIPTAYIIACPSCKRVAAEGWPRSPEAA